jgi:hypothetical protein
MTELARTSNNVNDERMLHKDHDSKCSVGEKKITGHESQGTCRQDELIVGKPPLVKQSDSDSAILLSLPDSWPEVSVHPIDPAHVDTSVVGFPLSLSKYRHCVQSSKLLLCVSHAVLPT